MLNKSIVHQEIEKRLQEAFSPSMLQVTDDSEHHRGHAGAASGGGHFTLCISAPVFANLPRVEAHRKIYQVLSDLLVKDIHALKITLS